MGLLFYLQDVADQLMPDLQSTKGSRHSRRFMLVHVDRLEKDMQEVRKWLKLPPMKGKMPHAMEDYPGRNKTKLSTYARQQLWNALTAEYDLYYRLSEYERLTTPMQYDN